MTASLQSQHLCFKEGQNGKNEGMKMQKQVNKSDSDGSDIVLKEKFAFI